MPGSVASGTPCISLGSFKMRCFKGKLGKNRNPHFISINIFFPRKYFFPPKNSILYNITWKKIWVAAFARLRERAKVLRCYVHLLSCYMKLVLHGLAMFFGLHSRGTPFKSLPTYPFHYRFALT
jgi:hypothetical protein